MKYHRESPLWSPVISKLCTLTGDGNVGERLVPRRHSIVILIDDEHGTLQSQFIPGLIPSFR